jgi:cation diffusion facilitator CzcD-associated flavoprotein CzcO
MQKDLSDRHDMPATNGTNVHSNGASRAHSAAGEVDVVVVDAGFSGVYLLYQLRKKGFNANIIEAGSGLGGI